MKQASIIVATYNRADILEKSLKELLKQTFPNDYEVIVVNDGSDDATKEGLKKFEKYKNKLKIFHLKHSGPDFVKNFGIKKAKYDIVIIMDDDCIPERNWLKNLTKPMKGKIAITSSFSHYGGTSTAYLKKALNAAGLFDLRFNKYNFRDDTDLVFRILDKGYTMKFVKNAKFYHLHKLPQRFADKIKYAINRVKIHEADPLLYKKHPERTKKFLDIKFGFLRNPVKDFQTATGLWSKKKKLSLSSPQGIKLIENKSIFHTILIILLGLAYVFLVKLARLYGSVKYKKPLI